MSRSPRYRRIVLKISGEALGGEDGKGLNPEVLALLANELKEIHDLGVEIGIVVGGGNIFRGLQAAVRQGMDRNVADHMGMLATVINGLALQDALERQGVYTRLQTAIEMRKVAEPFIQRRAVRHQEKGRVVIFAAGTGNPFFTTDTAAVLRAVQIGAEVIIKATDVDGVYDGDPHEKEHPFRFETISSIEVLRRGYKVMDSTAISLSMDNDIPIIVLSMKDRGNIKRAVFGESVGTLVTHE